MNEDQNKVTEKTRESGGRQHRVCPQCGSENIFFEIGFVTGTYKCNNCGYVGPVTFEFNDKEYRKFLEELRNQKSDSH